MLRNTLALNKERELGFLYACLLYDAIKLDEIKRKLELLVEECSDSDLLLIYIDLLDSVNSSENLVKAFRNITSIHWRPKLSEKQLDAITGIAYKRGLSVYNHTPAYEKTAKAALKKHPEVKECFQNVFPFIKF